MAGGGSPTARMVNHGIGVATSHLSPNKPEYTAATVRCSSSHALTRVPEIPEDDGICPPAAWVAAPTARLRNHEIGVVPHDFRSYRARKTRNRQRESKQAHVCGDLTPPERRSRGLGGARGHVPPDGAGGSPPTARVRNHGIGVVRFGSSPALARAGRCQRARALRWCGWKPTDRTCEEPRHRSRDRRLSVRTWTRETLNQDWEIKAARMRRWVVPIFTEPPPRPPPSSRG